MALGDIFINGKEISKEEFYEMVKKEQGERITHIIESHNSMEWVTDGELYFENCDVAIDYYELMHLGIMDELTPINPDEILLYTHNEQSIITTDTVEDLIASCYNNDSYVWTQYDEDNAIYLEIVREGLGL